MHEWVYVHLVDYKGFQLDINVTNSQVSKDASHSSLA